MSRLLCSMRTAPRIHTDMQPDPVVEAWQGIESLGPNIQALCNPGWTNPALLGTSIPTTLNTQAASLHMDFLLKYTRTFPECPHIVGTNTQCGLPQLLLNTQSVGAHIVSCHRTTRSRLLGLIGYLWAKRLVQPLRKFLPPQGVSPAALK